MPSTGWKIGAALIVTATLVGGQARPPSKTGPADGQARHSEAPPTAALQRQQPPADSRPPEGLPCNPCVVSTASPADPPRESFSELTLFLFASALALFVALLGWSDQIRGINKDTKDLEDRFLEETGIEKRDFLKVVRPKVQGEQFAALTNLLRAGRIQSKTRVDLLPAFKSWHCEWSKLERLSGLKYGLAIALTIAFFLAGVTSLFTHAGDKVRIYRLTVRGEMLVLALPLVLVAILIAIIICESKRERDLRAYLNSLEDEV